MSNEKNRPAASGGLWDAFEEPPIAEVDNDPPLDGPSLWDNQSPDELPALTEIKKTVSSPAVAVQSTTPAKVQSQTLYRKWRSQTFNELVGQDSITRTLRNAIASGRVGHAYLFCGPRGTGKTSTGRLLAKAVNCLAENVEARPCDKCEACRSIAEARAMDLIEIDAASNRGIDEVRELRDKINFQPSFLKKKIYIIDEAHMMTEAAFNALLKTLEEPPAHALFVLATTDPQDIPATVVSRCQRFDFQRIGVGHISERLGFICQEEGVQADSEALELIARQATGSLRDALSLLDQLIVYSGGQISAESVRQMLGVMNSEAVANFVDALLNGDMSSGLEQINRLVQAGTDLKRYNRELVEYLRNMMLARVNPNTRELLNLTEDAQRRLREQSGQLDLAAIVNFVKIFSQVDYNLKVSPYGQLPLEIALLEALLQPVQAAPVEPVRLAPRSTAVAPVPVAEKPVVRSVPVAVPEDAPSKVVAFKPVEPKEIAPAEPVTLTVSVAPAAPTTSEAQAEEVAGSTAPLELAVVIEAWKRTHEAVRGRSKVDAAILDHANPTGLRGNKVVLTVAYEFHYNKIKQDGMRRGLEEHLTRFLGQQVVLECVDGSKGNAPEPITKPATDTRTKRAADIFNARVVE